MTDPFQTFGKFWNFPKVNPHYIHANPVHHGFVKDIREWKFSSFQSLCSDKPTKLERDYVMAIFGNKKAFLNYHTKPIDRKYKWHD